MNDIQSLYQQMILDHNKNPRNFGGLEEPTHCAEGHNPLCGDEVTIFMNIKDNGKVSSRDTCCKKSY